MTVEISLDSNSRLDGTIDVANTNGTRGRFPREDMLTWGSLLMVKYPIFYMKTSIGVPLTVGPWRIRVVVDPSRGRATRASPGGSAGNRRSGRALTACVSRRMASSTTSPRMGPHRRRT